MTHHILVQSRPPANRFTLSTTSLTLLCTILLTILLYHSSNATAKETHLSQEWKYDPNEFGHLVWSAPFISGGGYCSEAISFALSLAPFLGERFSINQHGDSYNPKFVSGLDQATMRTLQPLMRNQPPKSARNIISICHSEPGAWSPALYSTSVCPREDAKITIGRTMFETDRLPNGWKERLNRMDYVWVPTHFHQQIFADGGVEPKKLVVIPEPIDTEFYSPENAATMLPFKYPLEDESKPKPFRFLSIFKWEERKGWKILLEAFLKEFASKSESATSENVILYILTSAYHSDADFQERIDSFVAELTWDNQLKPAHLPSIRLLQSGVPQDRMPAMYAGADAFVISSRGEGWGRPHVEAMSMGLPLIATHWSGPSEFMTQANSYPLRHDGLVSIEEGAFRGHLWAQPSVVHLRELMREVVSNPAAAQSKGRQARQDMVKKYCQPCVAQIVIDELARIQQIQPKQTKMNSNKEESMVKDEL